MTTEKQIAANRNNAHSSTGPKTLSGKKKSAQNARTHGIFSKNLFIEGEDPAQFEELRARLIEEEHAETTVERFYAEQAAQYMWRLNRLNSAESASIAFQRTTDDTRKMLNDALGLSESIHFKDEHLQPLSEDEIRHFGSCLAIEDEMENLVEIPPNEEVLKKVAPVYFDYLSKQAEKQQTLFYKMLMARTNLPEEKFVESIKFCISADCKIFIKHIHDYEKRVKVSTMRKHHQAKKCLPDDYEQFSRYRTALENGFHKAIKSLHEARASRK